MKKKKDRLGKVRTINLGMNRELDVWLDSECRRLGITRSALVRMWLVERMNASKGEAR